MIPFFLARNGVFTRRAGLSFPRQGGPYPEKWSDRGATVYAQWDKPGRELGEGAGGQVTREIAKGLGGALSRKHTIWGCDVVSRYLEENTPGRV